MKEVIKAKLKPLFEDEMEILKNIFKKKTKTIENKEEYQKRVSLLKDKYNKLYKEMFSDVNVNNNDNSNDVNDNDNDNDNDNVNNELIFNHQSDEGQYIMYNQITGTYYKTIY